MKKQKILIIILAISSCLFLSCKKESPKGIPTVTMISVAKVTDTGASSGGHVTSDGGVPVTLRGVCWSTSQTPTISNNKTNDGTGTGNFTSTITGLTHGTC